MAMLATVLHPIDSFGIGGAQRRLIKISNIWMARSHIWHTLCSRRTEISWMSCGI